MPNLKDFSNLENLKSISISPEGWVNPIIIEYGLFRSIPLNIWWRVKGTTHAFEIPVTRLDFISVGNYGLHFTEILEGFREEYIVWMKENFYLPWQQQYHQQYNKFILL